MNGLESEIAAYPVFLLPPLNSILYGNFSGNCSLVKKKKLGTFRLQHEDENENEYEIWLPVLAKMFITGTTNLTLC